MCRARALIGDFGDRWATERQVVKLAQTHLEFSYHGTVHLGLLLVEFEGLAKVLQALEGQNSLQLTVIYL